MGLRVPPYTWDKMYTLINLECKESSAPGDSYRSSSSEAPRIGAADHNTVFSPEDLEGLTEKVGTLGLLATRNNRCSAAKKSGRGGLGFRRLLLGTLVVANLDLL